MKKKSVKKIITRGDLIEKSIEDFKTDNADWKSLSSEDLYGLESYIDGNLYDKKYKHLAPKYGDGGNDEVILERLTFDAIKMIKGRRHQCDVYYDDAFGGYDDASGGK